MYGHLPVFEGNCIEYIDASGGAAVSCLSHSHPDVLAAMHSQLNQLAYQFFHVANRRGPG